MNYINYIQNKKKKGFDNMIIGIDMGHTTSGLGTGAQGCGYYEHVLNRVLGKRVIELLQREGHKIVNITVDRSSDQIRDRVNNANRQYLDMLISLHFNSGRKDPNGDKKTGGVEVLTYNNKTLQTESKRVCEKIAKIGFTNRGIKIRPDLSILRDTNAKAMLIEVCFIDDKDDMNLYNKNVENVAIAIVEGLLGKTITKPIETPKNGVYRVIAGSYEDKSNAIKRKEELEKLGVSTFLVYTEL